MKTITKRRLLPAAALILVTALVGAAGRKSPLGGQPGSGRLRFAAQQQHPVSFVGNLDRAAVLKGEDGLVRMELVMGAAPPEGPEPERVPTDLVVVLDRSGSMAGRKLMHAKQAVAALLEQLGPHDRFALVAYSDDAVLAVAPTAADGASSEAWMEAVAAIYADGGTNMARGLDLGLDAVDRVRTAGRVPRVILLSDGLANVGDATHGGLVRRAARAARGEYVLSTVGVGADFNEYLMTALADAGTGNYYYLETGRDLATVFEREFGAARHTVASALAVTIIPAEGVHVLDAGGYPLERAGDAVTFRPGSLFGGQERRIWVALRVPNQTLGEYPLGRFSLSYAGWGSSPTLSFSEIPRVACVEREAEFLSQIDHDTWSRGVLVDGYYELQSSVARSVKAGRRDEAERLMERFRDRTAAMNTRVHSTSVAAKLEDLSGLEAEVAETFTGADQGQRQNQFSKTKSLEAVDQRRPGSK